jgi:hypothetical protein
MIEIQKSYKKNGYVAARRMPSGHWTIRKVFEKDGKLTIRMDNVLYGFEWDENGQLGINIHEILEIQTSMLDKIKGQIKEQSEQSEYFNDEEEEETEEVAQDYKEEIHDGVVRHKEYSTIKACVENNIPVYLVGPAGSGKNFTLEQIADDLELDFHFTNSVQQEYKITGFIDAGGAYHETEFYKAFTEGGLFFLDELDASIPEVLVLLNAAIANGYFEFPNGKVDAHEDFRVVAAGNTVGDGANEQYTGRLVLDQATLDRFVVIDFDYDRNIEMSLAKGNVSLVNFIEDLRKQCSDIGIRSTFSYRCIMSVSKLEGKLSLSKILAIAVFKGMDRDTINTIKPNDKTNKYWNAFSKMLA